MDETAKRLSGLRESMEMSQVEASRKAGLARKTLSDIEMGHKSPRLSQLEALLSVYGVKLSKFFGGRVAENYKDAAHGQLHAALQRILDSKQERAISSITELIRIVDLEAGARKPPDRTKSR